jgi:hypothetical protein
VIQIQPLTPEILEELSIELGGCSFTSEEQRSFLLADGPCDVQAVPGNGKTTLLVAKLALLSRSWSSRTQGVCVISHTNTAREEIEKKLSSHPSASAFLNYPHFIGTVTAFIDRFLALPYMRGLGWSVQRIDDDAYGAIASSRWRSKPTLRRFSYGNGGRNSDAVETWVSNSTLADDFECTPEVRPSRLSIRKYVARQPGAHTPSGIELEELKAEMANDGFYRFADMTVLASQAIANCPKLVERIRSRFSLVILDEAQDTNGAQLALLNRLFSEGVAYQKLGDENQTLYEDHNLRAEDYWRAADGVIPLNETRRFGPEIAEFARRLTVRAPQHIEGGAGMPSRRSLILFDRQTIGGVIPAYAEEVRAHWGENITPRHDVRVVASRHSPAQRGEWPRSLVDYCSNYRSAKGPQSRSEKLCFVLRQASVLNESNSSPADIALLITTGVTDLLRLQGVCDAAGNAINRRTLWATLAAHKPDLPLKLKRLLRDHVLFGDSVWVQDAWELFCRHLTSVLNISEDTSPAAAAFMEFVEEEVIGDELPEGPGTIFVHDNIPIRLGSIHSVKGKTVDSILVVETEVWKGSRREERTMDLAVVLPHAFGIENRDFSANRAELAAATNIFVAVTRPREVLTCALRREAASDHMITAARRLGWHIRDLTA